MPKINGKKLEKLENARIKYQTVIDIFNSEGQIQWSRFNAILTINTVIVAILGLNKEHNQLFDQIIPLIPIIGLLICGLWFLMTYRGFEWLHFWITKARELEKELIDPKNINPINEGNEKRKKHCKLLKTPIASYCLIMLIASIYCYMIFLRYGESSVLFIIYGILCFIVGLLSNNISEI